MPLVELNLSAERNRTKPSMFALVLYQPRFLYVIHLGHWDAVFRKKKKKNGNSVYNTKKLRHSFHKRNNEENSAHLVSISSDVNAGTTERTKTKPQKREITQLSRGQKQVKEGLC